MAIALIAEGLGRQRPRPGAQDHPALRCERALGARIRQLAGLDLPLALHKGRRRPASLPAPCAAVLLDLVGPQLGLLLAVAHRAPRHQPLLLGIHCDFVGRKPRQRVGALNSPADIESADLGEERGMRPGQLHSVVAHLDAVVGYFSYPRDAATFFALGAHLHGRAVPAAPKALNRF